jgi:hypothetical protein
MDIPSYNFYYEADATHNPGRGVVWTDAYVDPAGHGWMVSSIAPVWSDGRLEGVVGIDVTLKTIIDRLLGLQLPWSGYAILVDREGEIIALPPLGEQDFKLREVVSHSKDSCDPIGNIRNDSNRGLHVGNCSVSFASRPSVLKKNHFCI